jgi:hypothetical protein
MIQLRCTKKVQDFIGIKKANLCEISDSESILGNWMANIFIQDRRKVICFMNERTLLSFVLTGVTKAKAKYPIESFPIGLEQLLNFEGVDVNAIELVIQDSCNIEITSTNSRKLLGNMNDLIYLYQSLITAEGGLANCDMTSVTMNINRTPQRALDWENSITVTKALLKCAT